MATALIGLGSNLSDRSATLDAALARLSAHGGVQSVAASRYHAYPPIGGPPGQGEYLNAAARLTTPLGPDALLDVLLETERALGRRREVRWGPRTIDLDLLLYDDLVRDSPRLALPHPRLAVRRFVLEPAAEVAADWRHPTIGWTIGRLLTHVREHPRYLALAGPIGVGKTLLAGEIAAALARQLGIPCRTLAEPIDDELLARFYADPAGRAWDTELEFVRRRTAILSAVPWTAGNSPDPRGWRVSDFWFDQALAYADLWLQPAQRPAFEEKFQQAARQVTRPKLLVVLDAATDELQRRIAARGRPYEAGLADDVLERLRRAIRGTAARDDVGPVLHLESRDAEAVVADVVAALAGME